MSAAIYDRQKNQALQGANQLLKGFPGAESQKLVDLIEALPIVSEDWNDEDKPVSDYYNDEVNWRQSMVGQLIGVNGNITRGANLVYTKAGTLINDIAADDELLAIGKQLVIVLDLIYQSLADKNADSFAGQYWRMKLEKAS
jgi:hypothetical protein